MVEPLVDTFLRSSLGLCVRFLIVKLPLVCEECSNCLSDRYAMDMNFKFIV